MSLEFYLLQSLVSVFRVRAVCLRACVRACVRAKGEGWEEARPKQTANQDEFRQAVTPDASVVSPVVEVMVPSSYHALKFLARSCT